MTAYGIIGALGLVAWLYLLMGRGRFWDARIPDDAAPPDVWPDVIVIVPARNEADVIARSVVSLLQQDYLGCLRVIVVDDQSTDGTVDVLQSAIKSNTPRRLDVIGGSAVPPGWTGKLWALEQGTRVANAALDAARDQSGYFLFTDADIAHSIDNVTNLVARAESEGRVQVSLMAKLSCSTLAERCLIPAFVYFFQMLYPFSWVNKPTGSTAAAAGGCVLVRREALQRAGGITAIRHEIIDDCALARRLRQQGPIWLGLTRRAVSLRPYTGFRQIGAMISRSAYAQLRYSPLLLIGTVCGMSAVFVAPALISILATGVARWFGIASWLLMALTYQPILRLYRRSPLWGLALPLVAIAYLFFTVQSAVHVWYGRGGLWKGRAQAMVSDL